MLGYTWVKGLEIISGYKGLLTLKKSIVSVLEGLTSGILKFGVLGGVDIGKVCRTM